MFKLKCFIVQLLLVVISVFAEPCSITIPTDLPNPMPVFITNNSLFRPQSVTTQIAENQILTLHCGGTNNEIIALSKQTVTLTCKNGAFNVDGKNYSLADLKCTKIPESDLEVTKTSCARRRGVILTPGFKVGSNFYSVFRICYDTIDQRTIYSESIVNGAAVSFKLNETTRRPFSADGMSFSTKLVRNLYKIDNQIKRFEMLFGPNQNFVNTTMYMTRGHLAPETEFIFAYEQLATYYYANCAPEWRTINAGNWARIEAGIRKLASSFGSDMLTYTSTLDVLELNYRSIYLGSYDMLPVPKWYYKVVMHPKLPIDLVIITLNNPFGEVGPEVEFCKNVCANFKVNSKLYKNARKGYTFCCELNDFWRSTINITTPYFDLPAGWSYKN